jgi:amino-acid N-acetyltransferase
MTENEKMMERIVIEPARKGDLTAVLHLLSHSGLPPDGLRDHMASAFVARSGQQIVGCAALELYDTAALLRSVAVADTYRGRGLGQRLTQQALDFGRERGITHVYLLTETAATFFPKFGFREVDRAQVPEKVKQSVEFTTACPDTALAMALKLGHTSP